MNKQQLKIKGGGVIYFLFRGGGGVISCFLLSFQKCSVCLSICLSAFLSCSVCQQYIQSLCFCLSVSLSVSLSVCLSVCPFVYLSVCFSFLFCLSTIHPIFVFVRSVYLSVFLSFCMLFCLSFCLYFCLSICLSVFQQNIQSLCFFGLHWIGHSNPDPDGTVSFILTTDPTKFPRPDSRRVGNGTVRRKYWQWYESWANECFLAQGLKLKTNENIKFESLERGQGGGVLIVFETC